ncbi:hypothetical protein PTT_16283 [Pyrenophora teres f. teres 0-1]|uniref:Uncharacterized protein n=1 Tax=Pyrenophora teres f. teres (strain 0-1) TaxID=861557 RepID=E3S1Y1_PYRTT|nr:hypothetical protein PTT_16283 [Pyrenophora teres f. teres 0-1]
MDGYASTLVIKKLLTPGPSKHRPVPGPSEHGPVPGPSDLIFPIDPPEGYRR